MLNSISRIRWSCKKNQKVCYLIGIAIILNIATACLAFVIVEVQVREWDRGEVLVVSIEPASTGGVCTLATTGTAHVVDNSVHVNVNLLVVSVWSRTIKDLESYCCSKKIDMSFTGEQ